MQATEVTDQAVSLLNPLIPELKMTPTLLLTLIAQIYVEKIASDRVRERQENEPLDFPPPSTGTHTHLEWHISSRHTICMLK